MSPGPLLPPDAQLMVTGDTTHPKIGIPPTHPLPPPHPTPSPTPILSGRHHTHHGSLASPLHYDTGDMGLELGTDQQEWAEARLMAPPGALSQALPWRLPPDPTSSDVKSSCVGQGSLEVDPGGRSRGGSLGTPEMEE